MNYRQCKFLVDSFIENVNFFFSELTKKEVKQDVRTD
jgi:hypothetical protein